MFTSLLKAQQTFYVNSLTGSDNNDGLTSSTPFRSFHKAYISLTTATGVDNRIYIHGTIDWSSPSETGDNATSGYTLSKWVNIYGTTANNSIFQSSGNLNTSDRRIFTIADNNSVQFYNLTFRNGNCSAHGGAIYSQGGIYMYDCIIDNNKSSQEGGGIYLTRFCRAERCQITNNTAVTYGGGVQRNFQNNTSALILVNCTIANNILTSNYGHGGGVNLADGLASITNCTITGNACVNFPDSRGHGIGIDGSSGSIFLKNNIVAVNSIGTSGGDLGQRLSSGTFTDNGGNIIGRRGANHGLNTLSATTWLDVITNESLDGNFILNNSNPLQSGSLGLSNQLSSYGNANGKSLSFAFNSIALNNGTTGTNNQSGVQAVSAPTIDQRKVSREGNSDIGAFELTNITVEGDLLHFYKCASGASNSQSIQISGNNLTNDIIITPPTGFEISLSNNSNYTNSAITLNQNSGIVLQTTLYIRMPSTQASNPSTGSLLQITSLGQSSLSIPLRGFIMGTTTVASTNLTQNPQASWTLNCYSNTDLLDYSVDGAFNGQQWYKNTTNSNVGGTAILGATQNGLRTPFNRASIGTNYYYCVATGCETVTSEVAVVTVNETIWTGATSSVPTLAANWNPNSSVPCNDAIITIPSGLNNYPVYTTAVNIGVGGDLTINSGARLSASSSSSNTNNGLLNVKSGATMTRTAGFSGSGIFQIEQTITDCANNGAAPTGRFWYMGVPVGGQTMESAFGASSALNRLWSWNEGAQAWNNNYNSGTILGTGDGYVYRTGSNKTLIFRGSSLYNGVNASGLTRTSGNFSGCHLYCNSFTAYLDWNTLYAAATNLSSTYCVRSYNQSSSTMVYDTYNATGNVSVQNSSFAMTRYIAPMQSFWITVTQGTGSIGILPSNLTHQPTATGLKEITEFPAFARLNLVDDSFSDQVVIYTDAEANSEVEDHDSKKFFLPNVAQVYCKVGNEKLVINALKKGKSQTSAPLTVELPTTKVYKFEMAESFIENGLVILEDRQEGIFQDMGINPTYEFFGNSGVIADRFVLHFQLPNGSYEGQAGVEDPTRSQIAVISNQNGSILVSLSADLTATGEVQVLDAAGRMIQTTLIKGQDTKLQITEGTGIYFVRVSTPMKSETKKVLVY